MSLDLELQSRLAELELSLDSQEQLQEEHRGPRALEEKQNHKNTLGEEVKGKQEASFILFSSSFIIAIFTAESPKTKYCTMF